MKYWLILFWRKARQVPNPTLWAIIALCALMLVVKSLVPDELEMSRRLGTVPVALVTSWNQVLSGEASLASGWSLATLVTALFMHGDIGHLTNNMLFFWAFGSLAVQHLGRWLALALFLFCGVCGNVSQTLLNPVSPIPIIGASGGVSGLEGIFLGMAILWRLPWPDVWPLARPIHPLQLGAFAVLGAVIDMVSVMGPRQGIAFGAHLGGFVSGLLIAGLIARLYPSREAFAASRWKR